MKTVSLVLSAFVILCAARASATPITITFDPNDPNATHPYTVTNPGGQSTYDPNSVYSHSVVSFGDAVILVDPSRPTESGVGVLDNLGNNMQVLFRGTVDDVSFYSSVNTQATLFVYINGVAQAGVTLPVNPGSDPMDLITVSGTDITELAFVYGESGNNSIDSLSFNTIDDCTPSPTPEPSSIALLGTGILGIAGVLRRRFRLS